jgi:hypothetical protein
MNTHSEYFVDTENFNFTNDGVFLKNDKSTWAKVVLNNLPLDDYLFHQNFIPQIKPDLGGRSISEFSFFNVRNIVERQEEKISNKKRAKIVSEFESSKIFSWDLRKRCPLCNDVAKIIYSLRTFPRENYLCSCTERVVSSFLDEQDEYDEIEGYIRSLEW